MKWLITGSSGYIGQHVVLDMLEHGMSAIGMDAVKIGEDSPLQGKFKSFQIDIRDTESVLNLIKRENCDGIINLAALKSVEDSIKNPGPYFEVNFQSPFQILKLSKETQIQYFIQSSTAAVYGNFQGGIVFEDSPTLPISPYGESKLKFENELNALSSEGVLSSTSLRFFNVLGSGSRKLRDKSRSNILPKIIDALENKEKPKIFGVDYPTPDGTCMRDYVHVEDIAHAHTLAASEIIKKRLPSCINLGTGVGHSVLEVIKKVEEVLGVEIEVEVADRRRGDAASLIAAVDLAKEYLNFESKKSFDMMIESALSKK